MYPPRVLEGLAHLMVRRRWTVISVWAVLTLFGAFSAGQVSKRWLTSFSIPGYSAYEANQRTLQTFGNGEMAPMVAVFHSDGDITKETGIAKAVAAAAAREPRLAGELVLRRPATARTSRRTVTRRSR